MGGGGPVVLKGPFYMAYIIMAYIVMACIAKVYIVMAYTLVVCRARGPSIRYVPRATTEACILPLQALKQIPFC